MGRRKKRKQGIGITEKRMIAGCILLAVSAVLMVVAGRVPGMAEWYTEHVYPVLVGTIGRFSGIFPFSLSELCLYVLLILLIGSLIHTLFCSFCCRPARQGMCCGVPFGYASVRAFRSRMGGSVMLQWASGLFLAAAVLVLLYVVNCGVNYRRISFSEKAGLVTEEYAAEDLAQVCMWLTEEVNARAGQVERDGSGVMRLEAPEEADAVKAMQALGRQYPELAGYYPKPKGLLVSSILSWQGLTGVYSPFTVEANYNQDVTAYYIPFTACHELSHLRGFMQEEEANFIAFLACIDAQRTDFQYSGYLMGWVYSMNALRTADYDAWSVVRQEMDEQVEVDLQANSKFWAAYDGTLAEVSNKVNDTYLKANGQADGVKSYGRMVDLIVAHYKKTEPNAT